jgi:hypothetical protein
MLRRLRYPSLVEQSSQTDEIVERLVLPDHTPLLAHKCNDQSAPVRARRSANERVAPINLPRGQIR